jgi:Ca2+/H+ antiporter, TMEM165/GDT1 family
MDLKTILTTFALIFLAELGDKTQLGVISMVSSTKKPLEVFIGAATALVAVTAVGILLAEILVKFVPVGVLHTVSGALFIVIGLLVLLGRF